MSPVFKFRVSLSKIYLCAVAQKTFLLPHEAQFIGKTSGIWRSSHIFAAYKKT